MTQRRDFSKVNPDELRELLLRHAREDRPTREARRRALVGVASAAGGAGLLGGGSAAAAPVSAWLVGKWLLIGIGAGALTVGGVEQVRSLAARDEPAKAAAAPVRVTASGEVASPRPADDGAVEQPRRPPASSSARIAPPRSRVGSDGNSPTELAARASSSDENSASPPEPAQASRLARELSTLRSARALLAAGAASQALEQLANYSREFPGGALRAEALALEVEGTALLGDRVLVAEREATFLREFPTSPLAARVRALAAAPR